MTYWRRQGWIGLPLFFVLAGFKAVQGARVAHIHWLDWHLHLRVPGRAYLSGLLIRLAMKWLKILRYRIVWTVHDLLPHEPQTQDDIGVLHLMVDSADGLIVHTNTVISSLNDLGLFNQNTIVIPQGNYIGHFGPSPSKLSARHSLGISNDKRVVLFFGMIRPYKGIPELLEAWPDFSHRGVLLIAGPCDHRFLQSMIERCAAIDSSILPHIRFIPNGEVASYFEASDAVCLPFRRITNSSSAVTAMSYGKPIIAPRLGSLKELPDQVGYFYEDGSELHLTAALQAFFDATELDLKNKSTAASIYAQGFSWTSIAEQTFAVYETVLRSHPAVTNLEL